MDDVDLDKNVPIGQISLIVAQQRVISIGKTLVGLGRLSLAMFYRPLVHCRAIMDCTNLRISILINTNVGPLYDSSNPTARPKSS
jgi:hypothetical protein